MKKIIAITLFLVTVSNLWAANGPETLSVNYFEAVRQQDEARIMKCETDLRLLDLEYLHDELDTDNEKLAFWINIYNTSVQRILSQNPDLYKDRGAFFKMKRINVGGRMLSFDDIEHGIIRHSRTKWSWGYIHNLFPGRFERRNRVQRTEPRIHFALNCGAKDCPPIFAYHSDKLDQELDMSNKMYLEKHHKIESDAIYAPSLMSWFRADFGGKDGGKEFLKKYGIISEQDMDKELRFLDYDWTLSLGNYR